MLHHDTPQTRCTVGVARIDITPPVGIYHRMWGAASHDRATGVHKPLLATAIWMQPTSGDVSQAQVVIGMDHCVVDTADMARLRDAVAKAASLNSANVVITLSHTHGSGWMSRSRAHFPGGDLIAPYLDEVERKLGQLAQQARQSASPASIVYGQGRCDLAAHRDLWDEVNKQFVCGFNPAGEADDTVMVARITAGDGKVLGTLVNYACHPTTLAWDNTAISPDYVGAMRETIEGATHAPCLFLQGASGDLGPREGFVGDWNVADRNGRQLGYAALSALEALPTPGTRFVYAGPVVSGTTIGTWKHVSLESAELLGKETWSTKRFAVELPYRHDLPTLEETKAAHQEWLRAEEMARAAGDMQKARDCRAMVEQKNRQITRLTSLPAGRFLPYPVSLWQLGDALWVAVPGELYQVFQRTLRQRFGDRPVVVITLANDWQPGYLPEASTYGYGIYQETIAAVGAGALEMLTEAIAREVS